MPVSDLHLCPIKGSDFIAEHSGTRRKLKPLGHWLLSSIEVRRWWDQVSGVEVSMLVIVASGTIAELGDLASAT